MANPAQVMVVQLRKGEKPPFEQAPARRSPCRPPVRRPGSRARPRRRSRRPGPLPGRRRGPRVARLSRCPSSPATTSTSRRQGQRRVVLGARCSPRTEYEEIFSPGGRDQVDAARLLDRRTRRRSRSRTRSRKREASANGEQLVFRKDTAVVTRPRSRRRTSRRSSGREVDLSGLDLPRVTRARSGARSSTTPGAGTATSSTTRTCTAATGRRSATSTAPTSRRSARGRAQLGAVADGRRAERLAHLRRRRRHRPGGDAAEPPRLHRPARRRPRSRTQAGLLPLRARSSGRPRYNSEPRDAARPARRRRQGRRLPPGDRRPGGEGPATNYFRLLQVGTAEKVDAHRQREARDGPAPRTLRGRAAAQSESTLRYNRWIDRQHREGLKLSNGDIGYMHITAMSGGGRRPVRQVLARLPLQEGPRHRRARQRRRLDRVLHHRQARAEAGGVQRPARHGAVPLPEPGLARALRGRLQRVQRLGRRGLRRALQGAQARHGRRRAVVGRARRHPQPAADDRQRHASSSRTTPSTAGTASGSSRTTAPTPTSRQDNDPASAMAGRDAQLEKAIEVALQKIKEKPWQFPERPAYPKP